MFSRTARLLLLLLAALVVSPLHAQWSVTSEPQRINPDTFNGIACADSLHCIAIGYAASSYPRVRKSTDGGRTWQWLLNEQVDISGQTEVMQLRPSSAAHPTPDLMLISVNRQRMLRSSDAGRSWDTVLFPEVPSTWNGGELRMFDARNGLLVYGAAQYVYATSDGGATWMRREARPLPGEHAYALTVSILSPSRINILTSNAANDSSWLYRSSDAGLSWSRSPLPTFAPYHFGDFSDPLHGWAVGGIRTGEGDAERDIIARTVDGGMTWTKVLDTLIRSTEAPDPWGLTAMDAYDARNVLVVGHRGKILRTRDGGTTWKAENSGIKVTGGANDYFMGLLTAVRFTGATTAIASGWETTIIRYDEASSSVAARGERVAPVIAPNPVLSTCIVRLSDPSHRIGSVRLFDLHGSVVKSVDDSGLVAGHGSGSSLRIDMADLPDGIYMLEIDGHVIEKVVKVTP